MDGALLSSSLSLSVSVSTSFIPPPHSFTFLRRNLQLSFAVRKRNRFPSQLLRLAAASSSSSSRESEIELETRKFELLTAVTDTQRGLTADTHQRSSIEEALVNVESFDAGKPIDLSLLNGTWRLQYTSAPDVLILLQSSSTLPFLEVDQIYQKFECLGRGDQSGIVRNIVRWSIPRLLQEREGATLLVSAKFSVVSIRNIYLEFEEILQFIRSFKAQVPVTNSQRARVGAVDGAEAGGMDGSGAGGVDGAGAEGVAEVELELWRAEVERGCRNRELSDLEQETAA
ncbi:hypothetical protein RD792_009249 [Penstemon davidsonii]|uniref:Plastid lipid-associated protein/fibrillin conserved domain-containing protein n=1 Tax=Penstemon davidsonii TaxID=160366 RepID=A0ABR0DBE1_9LAMI|nr:hypothetical protein RD792_009249 [Penstemon davidsonii]